MLICPYALIRLKEATEHGFARRTSSKNSVTPSAESSDVTVLGSEHAATKRTPRRFARPSTYVQGDYYGQRSIAPRGASVEASGAQAKRLTAHKPTKLKPSFEMVPGTSSDDSTEDDTPALSRTRREGSRAKRAQVDADHALAKKISAAWSAEVEAGDKASGILAEEPAKQQAEGHGSEKQATEGGAPTAGEASTRRLSRHARGHVSLEGCRGRHFQT